MGDLVADQDVIGEIDKVANKAADKSLDRFLELIGVDYRNVEAMNEFRSDLMWARRSRKFSEGAKSKAFLVAVALVTAAALAVFWDGLRAIFAK
jgi:hypothetical protein